MTLTGTKRYPLSPPGLTPQSGSDSAGQPCSTQGGGGTASGRSQPGASSRYKTEESRERNRQAQQRFRDRQKGILSQQEAEVASVAAQVERLRVDNERLAQEARIKEKVRSFKEKVLAVREAIITALNGPPQEQQEQEPAQAQWPPPAAPTQPLAQLLMQGTQQAQQQQLKEEADASAYHEQLPSGIDLMLQQAQQQAQQQGGAGPAWFNGRAPPPLFPAQLQQQQAPQQAQQEGRASPGALPRSAPLSSAAGWADGTSLRGGSAAGAGQQGLQPLAGEQAGAPAGQGAATEVAEEPVVELGEEIQAISLPEFDDPVRAQLVMAMESPEDFLTAWRQWQVDVTHCLAEAEATGLKGEVEMRRLEETVDHFVVLFWYASKLKPGFSEYWMVQGGAPEHIGRQLWPRVAAQMHLTPEERLRLLKQWRLCSKRVAQAEVSRRRWLEVLEREHRATADAAADAAAETAAGAAGPAGGVAPASAQGELQLQQLLQLLSQANGAPVLPAFGQGAGAADPLAPGGGFGALGALPFQPQGPAPPARGASGKGMAAVARSSLKVAEAVTKLAEATYAKDLAVKDFLGKLNWVFSAVDKARINVLCAPYCPDFLSICQHILFPHPGGAEGPPLAAPPPPRPPPPPPAWGAMGLPPELAALLR